MQALLSVAGVAFRHDGASESLFSDVSFDLGRGDRCCLVGDNGAGKSTLLDLVAGRLTPRSGTVARSRGIRVAIADAIDGHAAYVDLWHELAPTCTDHVVSGDPRLDPALARLRRAERDMSVHADSHDAALVLADAVDAWSLLDGWTAEAHADALLARLGVASSTAAATLDEVSGGERARCELARMLATRADLVLLDEPTEHLDADGCDELARIITELDSATLIATHDRALLDAVATSVVWLERGDAHFERGDWATVEVHRAERSARALREWDAGERRRAATERAAAGRISKARSMLTDPTTGRSNNDSTLARRAAKVERQAKAIQHRLVQAPPPPKPFVAPDASQLGIPEPDRSPELVSSLRGCEVAWPEAPVVLAGVDLDLARGEHIALVGPNGSGKSTLLATIAGQLEPRTGTVDHGRSVRIAALGQQLDELDPHATAVDACCVDPEDREHRRMALALLAALRVRERSIQRPVAQLSAGTRRKVAIARVLLSRAHLVILDEPTNHLDLTARDVVAEALARHPAALLVASHDRAFLERVGARHVDVRRWHPDVPVIDDGFA